MGVTFYINGYLLLGEFQKNKAVEITKRESLADTTLEYFMCEREFIVSDSECLD